TAAKRGVGLAVGDVRAEPPILDDDGLVGERIGAELPQRCGRRPALPGLRRRQQRERLVQRDREDLFLALERPVVVTAADVRAVPPRAGIDLDPIGVLAHQARQRQHLQRVFESEGLRRLRLEQRGVAVPGGHVRAVPPGLEQDRLTRLRVLAELALPTTAEEELLDLLRRELVRRDALRQRDPVTPSAVAVAIAVLSGRRDVLLAGQRALQVRAVP